MVEMVLAAALAVVVAAPADFLEARADSPGAPAGLVGLRPLPP
jgi:hypothetical protein